MTHSFGLLVFFFNDTATTEIYTLSLHDALPISLRAACQPRRTAAGPNPRMASPSLKASSASMSCCGARPSMARTSRSEEHTSELQSLAYLVCRLLLEKKKKSCRSTRGVYLSGCV